MGKFNNEERGPRGPPRGDNRGRPPKPGFKGGNKFGRGAPKVFVQPHRLPGVFVARGGKDDSLVTKNMVPG